MSSEGIKVTISEDGLQATIASIPPKTTLEEVTKALQDHAVTEGVQSTAIIEAIGTANKSGDAVENLVIAQGKPPRFKEPPRVDHRPRGEEGELPQLRGVRKILTCEKPEEVKEAAKDVQVLAVKKGEVLGLRVVADVDAAPSVPVRVDQR